LFNLGVVIGVDVESFVVQDFLVCIFDKEGLAKAFLTSSFRVFVKFVLKLSRLLFQGRQVAILLFS
jgi:hypothetical protein